MLKRSRGQAYQGRKGCRRRGLMDRDVCCVAGRRKRAVWRVGDVRIREWKWWEVRWARRREVVERWRRMSSRSSGVERT
jgi:hypothetical protein